MEFPDPPKKESGARANMTALSHLMTGGLSGFTYWHYKSDLCLSDVRSPTFFGDACEMMHRGDMIAVSAKDAGAILFVSWVRPGAVVTISLASCFAMEPKEETSESGLDLPK